MAPVVNAIDAYNANQTGGRMLQLITAIRDIPREKKDKYQHALNGLYNSFPDDIYVTAPFALAIGTSPLGIQIHRSDNRGSHQVDTVLALQELDNTAAGRALVRDIVTNTAPNQITHHGQPRLVSVTATARGNRCTAVNPDDGLTRLAAALQNGRGDDVSTEIREAMTSLGHNPAAPGSYDWLQNQINSTPIYELDGVPSTQPSSTQHGNDWISAAMLQEWVTNNNFPTGLSTQLNNDAEVVLGTALARGARPGEGTHSRVNWSASNTMSTMGQQRPSYIGLGHELIHAYHNQRGEQPGREDRANAVLGEYAAVGLGPFQGATHTENGLRQSANLPARDRYNP
jgi:hypothetical protein